jgi:protein gp37
LVNRYKGLKGWPDSFTEFTLFPKRIPQACNWPDLTGTVRPDKPWLNGYPRIIFLNDLGDGFAPIAPLDWAEPYIEMMEASPHIWLWLTKWPGKMVRFFDRLGQVPSNFWLGTSVTYPHTAWRVGELMRLRGMPTVLWASLEPLLGPVDFIGGYGWFDLLDWVCGGSESGLNARPSHPDWHRRTRDFCQANGIKYFFKQHGEWLHESQFDPARAKGSYIINTKFHKWDDGTISVFYGKPRAGRLLDDVEHGGMPKVER